MTRVHRECDIEGCTGKHLAKGLCEKHYRRKVRNGGPDILKKLPYGLPPEERFWMKVQKGNPEECWLWMSPQISFDGYGMFTISSRNDVYAHRYAYELLVKPIPAGLTIDHLCRNILCVNPAHMEPVTNGENVRRLWQWRKENGIARRRPAK